MNWIRITNSLLLFRKTLFQIITYTINYPYYSIQLLRILTEAELVSGRKVGREKIYWLHPEPLKELKQWLAFYEKFWENKLTTLKHVVENSVDTEIKLIKSETPKTRKHKFGSLQVLSKVFLHLSNI